jgi:hypothetical protein
VVVRGFPAGVERSLEMKIGHGFPKVFRYSTVRRNFFDAKIALRFTVYGLRSSIRPVHTVQVYGLCRAVYRR